MTLPTMLPHEQQLEMLERLATEVIPVVRRQAPTTLWTDQDPYGGRPACVGRSRTPWAGSPCAAGPDLCDGPVTLASQDCWGMRMAVAGSAEWSYLWVAVWVSDECLWALLRVARSCSSWLFWLVTPG